MDATATEVLQTALRLPVAQRADIAGRLIESLDGQPDQGVEEAWDAEIARRVRDLDSGAVETVPWAVARKAIMGSLEG